MGRLELVHMGFLGLLCEQKMFGLLRAVIGL